MLLLVVSACKSSSSSDSASSKPSGETKPAAAGPTPETEEFLDTSVNTIAGMLNDLGKGKSDTQWDKGCDWASDTAACCKSMADGAKNVLQLREQFNRPAGGLDACLKGLKDTTGALEAVYVNKASAKSCEDLTKFWGNNQAEVKKTYCAAVAAVKSCEGDAKKMGAKTAITYIDPSNMGC